MRVWWFLYHSVDGKGYETVKSNGLTDVLSDDNLQFLKRLDPPGEGRRIQSYFEDDKLVAVSYVNYTYDEMYRSCIYNYTILMYHRDYLDFQGTSKFERHFIKEDGDVPSKLGVLNIK